MGQPLLLAVIAFLMLLVGLTWLGYRIFYRPGRFLKQLGNPVITDAMRARLVDEAAEPGSSTLVTVLRQIGSHVPSSEGDVATLRAEMVRGERRGGSLSSFRRRNGDRRAARQSS